MTSPLLFRSEDLLNLTCLLSLDLIEVRRRKSRDTSCNFHPRSIPHRNRIVRLEFSMHFKNSGGKGLVCLLSKALFAPSSTTIIPFRQKQIRSISFSRSICFPRARIMSRNCFRKRYRRGRRASIPFHDHHCNARQDTLFRCAYFLLSIPPVINSLLCFFAVSRYGV